MTVIGFLLTAYPVVVELFYKGTLLDKIYIDIFISYNSFAFNYFYVMLGFILWYLKDKLSWKLALGYSISFIIFREILLSYTNISIFEVGLQYLRVGYFVSVFILIFSFSKKLPGKWATQARTESQLVYFTHYLVIVFWKMILPQFIVHTEKMYFIILFLSVTFSLLVYIKVLSYLPRLKKLLY